MHNSLLDFGLQLQVFVLGFDLEVTEEVSKQRKKKLVTALIPRGKRASHL